MSFIASVKHAVATGAVKSYHAVRASVQWLGRSVTFLGQAYIIPAAKAIFAFFRTGFGLGGVALGAGAGLWTLSESSKLAGENQKPARIAVKALSAATFVGAGLLLALGRSALL